MLQRWASVKIFYEGVRHAEFFRATNFRKIFQGTETHVLRSMVLFNFCVYICKLMFKLYKNLYSVNAYESNSFVKRRSNNYILFFKDVSKIY